LYCFRRRATTGPRTPAAGKRTKASLRISRRGSLAPSLNAARSCAKSMVSPSTTFQSDARSRRAAQSYVVSNIICALLSCSLRSERVKGESAARCSRKSHLRGRRGREARAPSLSLNFPARRAVAQVCPFETRPEGQALDFHFVSIRMTCAAKSKRGLIKKKRFLRTIRRFLRRSLSTRLFAHSTRGGARSTLPTPCAAESRICSCATGV